MAKRIFTAAFRAASCKYNQNEDHSQTIPNLAITPQQVQEMTLRGIPVSLPNAEYYETTQKSGDWHIEPMFRRSMSREELWETEQNAKASVLNAHKRDKKQFGE